MPNQDFIAQLLGLEDVILKDIKKTDSMMTLFIEKPRRDCSCPHCGTVTSLVHDYRTVTIKDIPLQYYQTLIKYRKRRYHCPGCGRHFNEPFSLVPKNCQISLRLGMLALNQLSDTGCVSRVAKNLGISASSVFRRFRDISFRMSCPSMNSRGMQLVRSFRQSLQIRFTERSSISFQQERHTVCRNISKNSLTGKRCSLLSWI